MFFKPKAPPAEWLVVGLGNPGKKYENSRHNIGFDALDYAAQKWGIEVRRAKFDGLFGSGTAAGHRVVLLKPQTFMNLSGKSIRQAAAFYKLPVQRVLVLFDDVSLAPGVLRIRLEGSAGGHNGLKSIIGAVGEGFPRIKIGVGERPHPEYDLADWVLSRFTPAERKLVVGRFADITAAAELLIGEKPDEAMSRYNGNGRESAS